MFYVARNPVTNRHARLIRPVRKQVNRHVALTKISSTLCTLGAQRARKDAGGEGMPLLRINATDRGLGLHGSAQPVLPSLHRAAADAPDAPDTRPIIVMVHGFRFAPDAGNDCPHTHILASHERPRNRKALSWPCALGLVGADAPGLGIAFGWNALGSLWQAHAQARSAGLHLAQVLSTLHRAAPRRPIHAIGHSMGARVILQALPHCPPGALHRLLLLHPAEYRSAAAQALATPAGAQTQVFWINSAENRLFDFALERLIPPPQPQDRIKDPDLPNLLPVHLSDPHTLEALHARGLPVAPPQRRLCHWAGYLRPGVFDLYRAVLLHPQRHPFAALQAALARPAPAAPSRFLAPVRMRAGLPLAGKAPS